MIGNLNYAIKNCAFACYASDNSCTIKAPDLAILEFEV